MLARNVANATTVTKKKELSNTTNVVIISG